MPKYLITGGAGFIGSHLVERLSRIEAELLVIDNFDAYYSRDEKLANISQYVSSGRIALVRISWTRIPSGHLPRASCDRAPCRSGRSATVARPAGCISAGEFRRHYATSRTCETLVHSAILFVVLQCHGNIPAWSESRGSRADQPVCGE